MIFKNTKSILGFDDRWFIFFGTLMVSLVINLILFATAYTEAEYFIFGGCQVVSILYTVLYWMIFRTVYLIVVQKYEGYEKIYRRYLVIIPAILFISFVLNKTMDFLIMPYLEHSIPPEYQPTTLLENTAAILLTVLVLAIYEGAYLFSLVKKVNFEKEHLLRQSISSQLESLKSQVNPHFLFNSLNSLTALIPEDSERAVRFVNKLSNVYRYILDIKDKQLITVQEELEFLDSYVFLLKERFGENLVVDIDIETERKTQLLIPLSLQLTMENAIKHNIITRSKPLHINIIAKEDCICISNNYQPKQVAEEKSGIGLQNLESRYRFFTDREVITRVEDEQFIVNLPLLNIDIHDEN